MTKGNIRLFQPAVMTGFRRGQRHQVMHTALLKIKNVRAKEDTEFYLGKRIAYVFKGKNKVSYHITSLHSFEIPSRYMSC